MPLRPRYMHLSPCYAPLTLIQACTCPSLPPLIPCYRRLTSQSPPISARSPYQVRASLQAHDAGLAFAALLQAR